MRVRVPNLGFVFKSLRLAICGGGCVALAMHTGLSVAQQVLLQQGTATFSQVMGGGPYGPDQAIDGILTNPCCDPIVNGWAIAPDSLVPPGSQTAVWETQANAGPGKFTFKMHFDHWNPQHLLGRFRFSVTQDDRSTFADGLTANGDVDANWIVLTNATVNGPAGMTFTNLPDGSVLAGGVIPNQGIYEVVFLTNLTGITGIRLEALEYPGLPGPGELGPGFFFNGNFVLTELQLTIGSIPDTTPPILSLPSSSEVNATSPAGAVVTYTVTATDDSGAEPTVVCTPSSGSIFTISPPPTTVNCTATDAAGNSATGSFSVTVNGAAKQLENLIASVGAVSGPWGITNSLDAKLQNALRGLKDGGTMRTCNSLNAFVNEALALTGKKLALAHASALIDSAKQIEAVLACP